MSSIIPNQSPFLREQRLFPQEPQPLSVEIDRAYTDIANAVNSRSLGLFTASTPMQTGETWYLGGLLYQGFRQLYTFTAAGNIPHALNTSNLFAFTRIYGTFTDGTNWYPLPYVNSAAAGNQVGLSITPTNIVITAGGGAPTITLGYVILEWISEP